MKSKNSSLQKNSILNNNLLNNIVKELDFNNPRIKKIEALLAGSFKSTLFGSGFEFNEVREYNIGDDLRHISWKTTAKTGQLHTKQYFAEKEIRSHVLVDISYSMFCGNKLEPLTKLLALILKTVSAYSEKLGGVYFSSEINYNFQHMEPRSQSNIMFETFINHCTSIEEKNIINGPTNIIKAIDLTNEFIKKRGFIYIISDFLNLGPWEKQIYELSQKQNIYLFQIYDPIDFNLTKSGYTYLIDPETSEKLIVNTDSNRFIEEYRKVMEEKQDNLNKLFSMTGVKHIKVQKEDFTST